MAETRADGCTTLGSWGVNIKEYYTIEEVSRLLHVHVTRIGELADQTDDPMPFRCFEGQRRNGFIYREDLVAWLDRHTVHWRDQRAMRPGMAASERPDEYVTIYRFMTHELGLWGVDLLVYARVLSFCTDPDGSYYESRGRCADFLGISSRQVTRSFARPCTSGLIDDIGMRRHQAGCSTREYRVNREVISAILHGGQWG